MTFYEFNLALKRSRTVIISGSAIADGPCVSDTLYWRLS